MNFLYCTLIGYFIGAISPSYIMSKMHGFDIRDKGSRNAGASNVVIVLGKAMGALCAVIDIAKAALTVLLAQSLMPKFALAFPVTGVACILGHIFPFYMNFKGGKGLACLGGTVLMYSRSFFLILLAVEIIVLFLTILFMFKGCGTFSEEKGLENFDVGDSSLSLCQHLIPDGFIELFEYEITPFMNWLESSFVLAFDPLS